ncbi:uncharacterized protein LOC135152094 [Daucus carota subsp. sativus]|uniref:uncharacterized protein LOC108214236 n=1 Tax=Daucus carota subsp. sativus TaxID=79200 RepID=UPI0007EF9E1E|nr:PREDICTED: uncharacterized protein LOC108214236 [Daucus carota subsp. sativus]
MMKDMVVYEGVDTEFDKAVLGLRQQLKDDEEALEQKIVKLESSIAVARQLMERFLKTKVNKAKNQATLGSTRNVQGLQHLKLTFPKFSEGDDVEDWLQDCNQYFEVFGVNERKKVTVAGMHLEGTARSWYHIYSLHNSICEWKNFAEQFTQRFGKGKQEWLVERFKKLKQTKSMEQYYTEFEGLVGQLKEKIPSLTEEYFLESFIGGMQAEVQQVLRILTPKSREEAYKKAKYLEQTRRGQQGNSSQLKTSAKESQAVSQAAAQGNLEVLEASTGQDTEINKDEVATTVETITPEEGQTQKQQIEVSVHAIEGLKGSQTITLTGYKNKKQFSILVDGGSTHSFLDEKTAAQLKCELVKTKPLKVMVANGNQLVSHYECQGFSWNIGKYRFNTPVKTLPMGSYDLVLGVDWLGSLGPVTFDFKKLEMRFQKGEEMIVLQGNQGSDKPRLHQMTADQFVRSCQRQEHGLLFILDVVHQPAGSLLSLQSDDGNNNSEGNKKQLHNLLEEYSDIFKAPEGLPPERQIEHSIDLKEGSQPFSIRPYRNSYNQKNEIEKLVAEMLESGIIRPSSSPFASPILLVKKKDGSWRFCIDYRKLNSMTIKNKFPIPLIEELLDELHGAKYFTKLDLRAGYHQVRMKERDVEKTAFRTHLGHYEFTVMPFGLTNAPATFQSLMNEVFRPYLRSFTLVFFDDILVYSKTKEDHLVHLKKVFQLMRQNTLFAKQSKCDFMTTKVAYLGHVISQQGVAVDQAKVADMVSWPLPQNLKALRGFLGLTGYYRKFVQHYGTIARPLTDLLQKDSFHWSEEATKAFQALKNAMASTPVLRLPDFSKEFTIESDACNTGIGAVLTQEGQPLAYFSKALGIKGQAMSTYEKELMALVAAVKKWSSYLMDKHFTIKTDHWSLKYLTDQKISNLLQQKWISKLLGYDYTIVYRKGKENTVADALSRRFEDESSGGVDNHEDMAAVKGEGLSGKAYRKY